jgi:hypothetical protein
LPELSFGRNEFGDLIYFSQRKKPVVKNPKELREFERNLIRSERPDYNRNVRIINAFRREAVALGVFPPSDALEGIELKVRIAKAVNNVRTTPRPRRRCAR